MAESAQQYLALVMSDEWVSAAIWQLVGTKVTLLNHSRTIPLEKDEEGAINQGIDTALDELGDAGLTLKNVLYILPHHWVKENDLIESRKRFLKSLSQDLVLEPLGFVVLTDTILASESAKHGVNFSGLIINDTQTFWDVGIYQNGEEQRIERIGKSGDVAQDIQELLARLQDVSQPERIVLLVSPEKEAQELEKNLQQAWDIPVETISAEKISEIAITTGGKEVLSEESAQEQSKPNQAEKTTPTVKSDDAPLMNTPPTGFAPPTFAQDDNIIEASTLSNEEISKEPRFTVPTQLTDDPESITPEEPGTAVDGIQSAPQRTPQAKIQSFFSGFSLSLPHSLNTFSDFFKKTPLAWIVGGGILATLVILGGVYFALSQSYRVQVDIWLTTEKLEIEDSFVVGNNANSASQSSLVASTFTEEVTLDKEVPTTGSKVIGDPAKGRVKVYNKTSQEKTFAAGTQIAANGVTFTIDEDITIASASSSNPETITSGSVEVSVTAVDIGPEGNLDKGTRFTVANFDTSSYEAQNDAAFSGGAQREIQAVSQRDIDQAVADLTEAGKSQLVEKIEATQEEGEYVLFTDEIETTEISTSAEVGNEAKFVNVSLTLTGKALRITAEQLQETAQKLLSDQVGENQTLLPESVDLQPQSVAVLTDGYELEAKIIGQGVPQIQASNILDQIQGVYTARAEQLLQEDKRVERAEFIVQPGWTSWIFTRLPNNPERISINIRIDHSQ